MAAAWPKASRAAVAGRAARRARHRLDRAARRRRGRRLRPAEAALSARARRPAAGRRAPAPPMIEFVRRLFARGEPGAVRSRPRDARAFAALHGASFHRGWSDGEFEQLLFDRNVVAHRATGGRAARRLHHVAAGRRARPKSCRSRSPRRGAARAWRGGCSISICAGSRGWAPARSFSKWTRATCRHCRLYQRAGFREVGRRQGYYPGHGERATALVLRRDLTAGRDLGDSYLNLPCCR